MSEPNRQISDALPSPRSLRLASGCVLFFYILTHLLNHTLGLISLGAAEAALRAAMGVWHSAPGTVVLYGAAALHFAMALRTLYIRHDWRFPPIEIVRLCAGFSLPLLLIGHVATTRLALALHDAAPSYSQTVSTIAAGGAQEWQIALLAPGWVHGCLGLWISLQRSRRIRRWRNALIALAVALPLTSAAGFLAMSREAESRGLVAAARAPQPTEAVMRRAEIGAWRDRMTNIYIGLIAGALLLGPVRRSVLPRR